MKNATLVLVCLALVGLGGPQLAHANPAVSATLTSAAVVPPIPPNPWLGQILINISASNGEICYDLAITGPPLPGPWFADIHLAPAGAVGVPAVPLSGPNPPVVLHVRDCKTIDKDLAKDIMQHAENFYVDVHLFAPNGPTILRGQLSR